VRTIGRHWHTDRARGDRPATCDYCAALFPRSELRKNAAGKLYCPMDAGPDEVTLTEANAAATPPARRKPDPGGRWVDEGLPAVGGTSIVDAVGPPPGAPANWVARGLL
jgi:hypothetical protein